MMPENVKTLIGAADQSFRELTRNRGRLVREVQEHFQGILYIAGYSIADQVQSSEEFGEIFRELASHPVCSLWGPNSILNGAEAARKISKTSIDQIADCYFKLPVDSGAFRLFTRAGEEFEFDNGIYKIVGHTPDGYGSPVKCEFVRGEKSKQSKYQGANANMLELCGDLVASTIDTGRMRKYAESHK